MTFQPSSIWDPTFVLVLSTQMSFTNKCQPLTYHIIYTALRYISSAASGQKNMSRRKNIYKLMILTLLNYVARSYATANACNLCVLKFNNKGYFRLHVHWAGLVLYASIAHIPCRLSRRGHKLHICVSVMRVCLHVANLMIIAMLLCAHR